MASQNLPGLAVLAAYGYRPKAGPLVASTGLFTLARGAVRRTCGQSERDHRGAVRFARRFARSGEALDRRGRVRRDLYRVRAARRRGDGLRRRRADPDRDGGGARAAQRVRVGPAQRARRRAGAGGGAGRLSGHHVGRQHLRDRRRLLGAGRGRLVRFFSRAGAATSQAP